MRRFYPLPGLSLNKVGLASIDIEISRPLPEVSVKKALARAGANVKSNIGGGLGSERPPVPGSAIRDLWERSMLGVCWAADF